MAAAAFMDRDRQPTPEVITEALGEAAPLWQRLTAFIRDSYGIEPTYVPPSKNYGWEMKYRKGGKTLMSLTPDDGGFTALVVLGRGEALSASELELGEHVRTVFEGTRQLRDGRWLFIPVESERDVQDIQALLAIKRRPRRAVTTQAA